MTGKPVHDCGADDRSSACPKCIHARVRGLQPGDVLTLIAGTYDRPITCVGLRGNDVNKIVIRGTTPEDPWWEKQSPQREGDCARDALVTSGVDDVAYRERANEISKTKQADGSYPGLYYVADEACLYLLDCQHVVVENLFFQHCWPTAVYIDNGQDIAIRNCQFRWGTYAIGAFGLNTRHLLVEGCRWQQNPKNNGTHWKSIAWHRIHGHTNNSAKEDDKGIVNIEKDYRLFDGDFFCSWRIAGFVKLRRNLVEDAFNAFHFFNDKEQPISKCNVNVVIENNRFERIRDNAIEPEGGGWNWVIRHNVLIDVYSWISLEMKRSGWFYIYGNVAWHTQSPGPGLDPDDKSVDPDKRTGGAIFKLPSRHVADGPTYFFHNSFFLRERIAKKKRFAGLKFFNNAICVCDSLKDGCGGLETLFASDEASLAITHHPSSDDDTKVGQEKRRFTKDWANLAISFYSNIIQGPDETRGLKASGYELGPNSRDGRPGFTGPNSNGQWSCDSFKLEPKLRVATSANNSSAEFELETRDKLKLKEKGERNMGAYQDDGELFELSKEFGWIETD